MEYIHLIIVFIIVTQFIYYLEYTYEYRDIFTFKYGLIVFLVLLGGVTPILNVLFFTTLLWTIVDVVSFIKVIRRWLTWE